MPELPEAENIANALKRTICGRKIERVEIFSPAMRTSLLPLKEANIEGSTIIDIRRRGRYVVAELDNCKALLMHFGMSGVVRVENESVARRKHEHVFIYLTGDKIFRFECTRRFSLLMVCELDKVGGLPKELNKLGVEPLTSTFTPQYLYDASRKRNVPVKNFIMDNSVVVGIGNIYSAETLFAAKVLPNKKSNLLSLEECKRIVKHSKLILQRAIEAGGSSISDFLNVDGSEGKFSQELQVYGREKQPCLICGNLIKNIKIGGRSSFFCPKCQK